MKAVILHGTQGSPSGNWFPWLKKQLLDLGFQVWVPELPNANQPSLQEWTEFILSNSPFALDEETILIGHSSGAVLVLTVLQSLEITVKAGICVAAFKDNDFLKWSANDRLFDVAFNFKRVNQHAKNLIFINSNNDPYVPQEHGEFLASKTAGKLIIIPEQKHFNLEASPEYNKFPRLLEIIKKTINLDSEVNNG